jgi:hypothetical protein
MRICSLRATNLFPGTCERQIRMRRYFFAVLPLVPVVLILGSLMGCSSKPKFTGCVGNNDCRPQEINSTPSTTGAGFTIETAPSGSSRLAQFKVEINANDMVWDPTSQQIYLSAASSHGANRDTITALNPFTGQFGTLQNAGTGGDRLAAASDGSYPYGPNFHYDETTGYVYGDDGQVVDPSTGTIVGSFPTNTVQGGFSLNSVMVPDGALNIAYFLGHTDQATDPQQYALEAFDLTHFTLLGEIPIPNVVGTPVKLIRWGSEGLAFLTGNPPGGPVQGDGVYVISGAFVTNPAAQARVVSPDH